MSNRKKVKKPIVQPSKKNMTVNKKKTTLPKVDNDIKTLQNSVGNQALQSMFESGFIQGKLTIGQPNDKYEQEADRVADEVMRMPEPKVQRNIEEKEEELIQTKPIREQITPLVQRQPEEEEEALLQTKSKGEPSQPTPHLESNINALEGAGQPLSKETRAFFEPRFGQDFSKVRVHNDSNANQLARSINARAFTKGNNVVFGRGEYNPKSSKGKRLLGHELVHVRQQNSRFTTKYVSKKNNETLLVRHTSEKIQKDPVATAGLGLAVFALGRDIVTSGSLSHQSTPATYMHPGTPTSAKWKQAKTILHIKAFHPRLFMPWQHFYFRLAYEYNGYDIRNATINILRSKSSSMRMSSFNITWSPSKQSRPKDPVAQIIFNISGRWDPTGRGDYSFWGKLVISSSLIGNIYKLFTIGAEQQTVQKG